MTPDAPRMAPALPILALDDLGVLLHGDGEVPAVRGVSLHVGPARRSPSSASRAPASPPSRWPRWGCSAHRRATRQRRRRRQQIVGHR